MNGASKLPNHTYSDYKTKYEINYKNTTAIIKFSVISKKRLRTARLNDSN